MILFLNVQKTVLIVGWLAFALLVLFIIYRTIIRKFKQKEKERKLFKELYIELHPIEKNPAAGIVPIYIESHSQLEVQLRVFSHDLKVDRIIETRKLKKGGNVISFDTLQFENGIYFFEAITHNQKTRKKIAIQN